MSKLQRTLNYFIALIWLINGLFCKLFQMTPRHQEIVAQILGFEHSHKLTIFIGLLEVLLAVWIILGISIKTTAILQIIAVLTMNIIELIFAPQLLLWGRANLIFAILFSAIIYFTHFGLTIKRNSHAI